MRIVEKKSDMAKMFRLATNEAAQAFNDPSVFIEHYVMNPRHIEFQILADNHGNVIHLGERECSVQRKHQKLLEEAPSSALTPELRKKMGDEAIKIATAVKYSSAGTVEFLLDSKGDFYFMEMNTRIQVEHPVTEAITGLDLIEQQIRIARGEELQIKQEDVKFNGWAIEFRINAEDPQSSFAPNLGIIQEMSLPKGKNIRVDTGVKTGSEILPFYDSMIAKLIVTGEDRAKAIANGMAALRKTRIKGLKTTIPFHKAVLSNSKFKKGNFNTSFIEKDMGKLFFQEPEEEEMASFFATWLFAQELKMEEDTIVDYNKGKNLNPWILNKRLKSI
jgi:acetyl-CoA carboxylase biotin carboxylase subunit